MSLDVPWYHYHQLVDMIYDLTYATEIEAAAFASLIVDVILDVGQQALDEATDHTNGVKIALVADIDGKIANVMLYIDEETDLIYDQLELWLDDVEDWITFLVEDITGSIEENIGMTEENIEGMGAVIGDNISVGIEETGSWIGNVYDNIKTSIFDTMSDLVNKIAGLIDLIIAAPELVIAKMLTELIPAEAARWLLTAGSVLTGVDMGHWFNNFRSAITGAGEEILTFDVDEVSDILMKSFKIMKDKIPELLAV